MRFWVTLVFILIRLFSWAHKHEHELPPFYFSENKGQFPSQVKFRSPIPGGLLFLENNTFTYHFYDVGMLTSLHNGSWKGNIEKPIMKLHAYKMEFLNANPTPEVNPQKKQAFFENYFIGDNSEYWTSNVSTYQKVEYKELYSGINLQIYSDHAALKYDIIVQPGANPGIIEWQYVGLDDVSMRLGKLQLLTSLGQIIEDKPYAYQIIEGKKKKVNCKYVLEGNKVKYYFPKGYDTTRELIIDPILVFSTYSGSTSSNFGYSATYDALGYLYSGSSAFGIGYPVTTGAYQTTWAGGTGGSLVGVPQLTGTDIVITKWDTNGTAPIYSTYLGGSSDELPHSLIVNENNELYVMGTTGSANFPKTPTAYDTSFNTAAGTPAVNLLNGLAAYYPNGSDICITRFDSAGSSLLGSTYIGGTHNDGLNTSTTKFNYADEIRGEILLDQQGDVYVVSCTRSNDIPTGSPTFQMTKPSGVSTTDQDGVVFKLDHKLQNLFWSTYYGGNGSDAIYSISIDSENDIYISGGTTSNNLPFSSTAIDTSFNGDRDGFVAHINATGSTLLQSSYFGSANYDQSYFVELDKQNNVYIYGQTSAPSGQLIQNATYNKALGGQFVTKITPVLDSIIWSTRFGKGDGTPDISPTAFLVDLCNSIYLSGWGSSIVNGTLSTTGLDTAGGALQNSTDGHDFYLMVLADDASQLNFGTYFGGSAREHVDGGTSRFDKKGKIYQAVCAGCPGSGQPATSDFPTFPNPGAHSNINGTTSPGANAGCNLAVFKVDFKLPVVVADFQAPAGGCAPFTVNFNNTSLSQANTQFHWNFGDGNTSTSANPTHTYTTAGTFSISLVLSDTGSCNFNDTIIKQITIGADSSFVIPSKNVCQGTGVEIGIVNNPNPNIEYNWSPNTHLNDTNISNPIASPPGNTLYTLFVNNGFCTDTITQQVLVDTVLAKAIGDTFVCSNDAPFLLNVLHQQTGNKFYWSLHSNFSDTISTNPNDSTLSVTPTDSITTYYVKVIHPNGCVAYDSIRIRVKDLATPLKASFTNPGVGCAPFNVSFNNTSDQWAATYYFWNFGNGQSSTVQNPSIAYPQKGTYTVTLVATDSSICPQQDTFKLDIHVRADTNYQLDFKACYGQPLQIGISPDTIPGTTYNWFPGTDLNNTSISNPLATLTQNTSYLLVVNGVCTDSITNKIEVDSIFAETDNIITACSDQSSVQLIGKSKGTGIHYIWGKTANHTDTLNTVTDSTYTYNLSDSIQRFYFTVKSKGGCIAKDSVDVVITDKVFKTTANQYICENDTVTLSTTPSYPNLPVTYNWTPTQEIIGRSDTNFIKAKITQTTSFYVSAIDDSGCVFKDTILVELSPLSASQIQISANPDTVVKSRTTQLKVEPFNQNFSYWWYVNDGLNDTTIYNPIATPTKDNIQYAVRVTDKRNSKCTLTARIPIRVREFICGEPDIFIPNAFSPNGDGENDELLVFGENVETMGLKIYNRWGELVFESNSQEKGWPGTINNEAANSAVYMYYLDVTCANGEKYFKKGNITLLK